MSPPPLRGRDREGVMASEHARQSRCTMIDADRELWSLLRRKQLQLFHFRREAPLGDDSVCIPEPPTPSLPLKGRGR